MRPIDNCISDIISATFVLVANVTTPEVLLNFAHRCYYKILPGENFMATFIHAQLPLILVTIITLLLSDS